MRLGLKKLLIFAFLTRLFILALPWLTTALLFPEAKAPGFLEFTQNSWNRWDGPHYLYLAQNWYVNLGDEANFIVFFPLYPLLLKPLIALAGNPALSAIFLSITFFMAGIYFMYKLLSLEFSPELAERAVIAAAIFPTSYFFNSPYTESLFLLIFSLTFFAAKKKHWLISGIFAGLGAITRPFGILLLPALLIEWFSGKSKKWYEFLTITLPSFAALLFYLFINKSVYGNPYAFKNILMENWQKYFVSPFDGLAGSWRIALSGELDSFGIMVGWAEALTLTALWVFTPLAFKLLKRSWAVYCLLSVILLSSTSFILSTPRYLLSIPPLFVMIALAENNYFFKTVWRFTAVALLFCLSMLFTRGQWAF